jgi:thymidylate synthase
MNKYEKQYKNLLKETLFEGEYKPSRTGIWCHSLFAQSLKHDLKDGFPLLTSKKMYLKNFIHELIWMLNGDTNIKYLKDNKVNIWDAWANENGDLGPVYGYQLRKFNGVKDQIKEVIENIKKDPHSRRHLLTMWNPLQLEEMALPPCHFSFQFYVAYGTLNINAFMRSGDLFIGVPYDFAFYAALLMVIANEVNLEPRKIALNITDCHIYENHVKQCLEYNYNPIHDLPKMTYIGKLDNLKYQDFTLLNYNPEKFIKTEIAI